MKENSIKRLKSIKNFFLYYSYDKEMYKFIEPDLRKSVYDCIKLLLIASCILTALCFMLSFFIKDFEAMRNIFITTVISSIVLYLIFDNIRKDSPVLNVLSFLFIGFMYFLNIFQCFKLRPNESPMLFTCVLFLSPIFFCYKPYFIWTLQFAAIFCYAYFGHLFRNAELIRIDLFYHFLLSVFGIIVGYGLTKLKIHSLYLEKKLSKEIENKKLELNKISREFVRSVNNSLESKNVNERGHSIRVADYSVLLAKKLNWSESKCESLWMDAIIHDMKQDAPFNDELENHRIIKIADAYDEMISNRFYRPDYTNEYIKNELLKGRGTSYDSEFLDAFLELTM